MIIWTHFACSFQLLVTLDGCRTTRRRSARPFVTCRRGPKSGRSFRPLQEAQILALNRHHCNRQFGSAIGFSFSTAQDIEWSRFRRLKPMIINVQPTKSRAARNSSKLRSQKTPFGKTTSETCDEKPFGPQVLPASRLIPPIYAASFRRSATGRSVPRTYQCHTR